MHILSIRNLTMTYSGNKHQTLAGVNLVMEAGSITALVGKSGSGKSTLLKLISGLERPDKGTIEINDKVISDDKVFVLPEHRKVGMVFQDYALFPHMTVEENISFGVSRHPDKTEIVSRVLSLVKLLGKERQYPHELSGGEQQRIALARALAADPILLLLDEPFSNLDDQLKARLRDELFGIIRKAGLSCLFVTHDTKDALLTADQIAVIEHGVIEQIATPEKIYYKPVSRYVANFFGQTNVLTSSDLAALNVEIEDAAGYAIRPESVSFSPVFKEKYVPVKFLRFTFGGELHQIEVELENGTLLKISTMKKPHILSEKVFIKIVSESVLVFPASTNP